MALTYEPISSTTLGSAASSVTFSSISGSYTDLIIICNWAQSAVASVSMRFNGDTGTNYSYTHLNGNGSTASSTYASNVTRIYFGENVFPSTTIVGNAILNIMNYANTTTYKTVLTRSNNASSSTYNGVEETVGLWRSTSAITSIVLLPDSGNFAINSTFTLYGVKAA